MRRRPASSVVANPVLVGAVTTLVVVVAIFLAYNANNGLPFVPTTQLRVQLPSGAMLVKGNEVRAGGFRVGVIQDMRPLALPDGRVGAELDLKLDETVGRIPRDSHVTVRPRSALGLKYVELTKGRSREAFADGDTLPVAQTTIPVELDEFYNMFDDETREAARHNLRGFGDALNGRGIDLHETIRAAPAFLGPLERVMRNLADPETDLESFFGELGDFTRVLAPVSPQNARLFTDMADTFEAFSRDPAALQATISKSPPALEAGTRSLRVQRPFLARTAALSQDLLTAARELDTALPPLSEALRVGTPVQRRMVQLNRPLRDVLANLDALVRRPAMLGTLTGLEATGATLNPTLRFLGPNVTVCNAWTFFWTPVAEHFTAPDSTGQAQRALLNSSQGYPSDSDHVGRAGANEFAHGVTRNDEERSGPQRIHNHFYFSNVHADGTADCAGGNVGFMRRSNPFRDKSLPGDPYRDIVVDEPRPPSYGPVHGGQIGDGSKGAPPYQTRVPPGQTFSPVPEGLGRLDPKAIEP